MLVQCHHGPSIRWLQLGWWNIYNNMLTHKYSQTSRGRSKWPSAIIRLCTRCVMCLIAYLWCCAPLEKRDAVHDTEWTYCLNSSLNAMWTQANGAKVNLIMKNTKCKHITYLNTYHKMRPRTYMHVEMPYTTFTKNKFILFFMFRERSQLVHSVYWIGLI